MKNKNQVIYSLQRGFTLIELMIVIAILGILASIAISSYQDYVIRSKVSEASAMIAPFATAVGTFYWTESTLPTSRTQSGQGNVVTKYIEGVTITVNGLISVNINEVSTGIRKVTADDMYLIFTPLIVTGAIDWKCSVSTAEDGSGTSTSISRLIPSNCR